ncbi:Transcription cofactor vestigial-like protein 3 [Chelonia mydas]|uniref:Transcription cofactor vestigial-like protein 3 n=1 Tax=Chelonia mydas TaxID=8469 RepID=M7BA49_CHEMY|nr:Transcription cofactor vestigial-like protein 3 [Chelonia mydas]
MQESLEVTLPSKQEEDEKDQPAEMEYLNSRCVLFTYFQGDIGSVVDEHFSRALNQASSFNPETALSKNKAGLSPLWRVRAARIPAPQCDMTKTDPTTVTSATSAWAGAFHGTVDIVPSFGFDTGEQPLFSFPWTGLQPELRQAEV